MAVIYVLLAVLVTLGFLLRASFFPKTAVAAVAVAFALWALWLVPWITQHSRQELELFFTQRAYVLNVSLCLCVEAVLLMLFCLVRVPVYKAGRWPQLAKQVTACYPGLLFDLVLGYVSAQLLYAYPGIDFAALRWGAAAVMLVGIPLCAFGLRKLLPDESLRLELLFITQLFILLLAILMSGNLH